MSHKKFVFRKANLFLMILIGIVGMSLRFHVTTVDAFLNKSGQNINFFMQDKHQNLDGDLFLSPEMEIREVICNEAELIKAIEDANQNLDPDVIHLSEGCTYQLSRFNNINTNYEFNGLPIISSMITINGHGAIIESVNENMRAFEVATNGDLYLNNLEIRHFTSNDDGAAILNFGTLTLTNSTLAFNKGIKGGGLFNLGITNIYNSTFYYNSACC
jgi:hypothetical protein